MVNPSKLIEELIIAGIKSCGCSSDGIVWGIEQDEDGLFNEIQDREDVIAILSTHDPSPDDDSVLRKEYNKAGVNSTDMIFALWKKVMASDPADADDLQSLMDGIDASIN